MDNIPRFLVYASGIFIISSTFTLFTSELLFKIADPGWVGTAFLLGYTLVYMNIVFVISRRFMRRLEGSSITPYLFAVLTSGFPVLWIFMYDAGFTPGLQSLFAFTCLLGTFAGAYLGHRAGLKAQVIFQEKLIEYLRNTGQLPDELKRAHDNLNKN
ncbi:MAG: hypothetical protein MI700_00055 [Balneolales bacterium]|nr:hypothetical protein [Balneolales bacterium]